MSKFAAILPFAARPISSPASFDLFGIYCYLCIYVLLPPADSYTRATGILQWDTQVRTLVPFLMIVIHFFEVPGMD